VTNYLRRISGSVWGASLADMRRLYLHKIRCIISDACGAWFLPDHHFTQARMETLEALQRHCLVVSLGHPTRPHTTCCSKSSTSRDLKFFFGARQSPTEPGRYVKQSIPPLLCCLAAWTPDTLLRCIIH
jgi:hypothetical protein